MRWERGRKIFIVLTYCVFVFASSLYKIFIFHFVSWKSVQNTILYCVPIVKNTFMGNQIHNHTIFFVFVRVQLHFGTRKKNRMIFFSHKNIKNKIKRNEINSLIFLFVFLFIYFTFLRFRLIFFLHPRVKYVY